MPNYRRFFEPGATYFFTVVTDRRRPLFNDERARIILRSALREARERWSFGIDAFVLLPDHLHCLWTLPRGDSEYPRRWAWIKGRFTRQWLAVGGAECPTTSGRRRDGRRGVLQPKYWEHLIRDDRDLHRSADYIHFNPVKHGLVDHPRDWPYSTFHRWCKTGDYPEDWGNPQSRIGSADLWSFADLEVSAME